MSVMHFTHPPAPDAPVGKARWRRRATVSVLIVIATVMAWLGYIGAFGGQLYFDLPASGPPEHSRRDVAAIIFSGDMGFKIGMGPRIANELAAIGVPVTGVSSLVHFRTRRSPTEIRAFLQAAMAHATRTNGATQFILIGQSYGADMLQVGLATLPEAERRRILLVEMVVPTDTVYFRISPGELFDLTEPDAQAVPTARLLTWVPALCVRGAQEKDSLCPLLRQSNMEHVTLPGGHLLHWDNDALAAPLLAKVRDVLGVAR